MARASAFLQGMSAGVLVTLLAGGAMAYGLQAGQEFNRAPPDIRGMLNFVYANLGLSLPVFAALALLYANGMRKLGIALKRSAPIEEIAQLEQLVDTWTNLFFGVGVIWTAIGMRSALVEALGDPASTLDLGAYAVLQRLVDGGILLALSTTIFGGVGGYLMRLLKALSVGTELKRQYSDHAHAPAGEMQASLQAIEARLREISISRDMV